MVASVVLGDQILYESHNVALRNDGKHADNLRSEEDHAYYNVGDEACKYHDGNVQSGDVDNHLPEADEGRIPVIL